MIKKSLASHDVKVTSSSGTTIRDLLTKTKTTPPPHLTPNVIYEISCNDCTATYNGQTNRPLIKRIKEHESHSRLHLHNPDDFSHNQSAPAHHSRTTGHKIAWDRTTILTTTRYKTQLDLTEHTSIQTRNPSLNRTDSAPTCSKLWDPIIPKIACTIKPRPAGISFPKKKWFYYFSIFYYFRFLLLTSVKESTASPQLTDTTPTNHLHDWHWHHSTLHIPSLSSHSSLAEEDWHMPIESSQYFIILFRVNQVFTFYHFIDF